MTGLISDDGAVSGTCRQNGRSQDTRQEGWRGGRLLVGKTPHFYQSDQISKKLSFVSNLRVFLGGRRKASEGLICPYTPYKFPC